MNNERSAIFKKFKQKMTLRLLKNVITEVLIYCVVFLGLFLIGKFICGFKTWHPNEPTYIMLKKVEYYIPLIVSAFAMLCICIVFIRSWLKALGYLEEVLNATENIYNSNNELIKMPPQLKEVEEQMNQIKLNVMENKRLAKEAEQRKNDLVVYLAHDLKTPLTSVIGYLTLLHDEQQISDELRQKYLSISLEKAQRLEDLINEFFEITRFNLTSITLELSKVNLTRMLEQITYEFKPMLSDKNLKCTLNSPPDITIKCDVDKMQRVFDNLLRNAVNYSFEDSTISINVNQYQDETKISFTNNGDTISKEKLQRLFEQFYRLDTARTTKSGGAGLGLAISKQIVELHNGTITAYSENEINTFEVVIPQL